MKPNQISLQILILATGLGLLAGCASTGYDKGSATASAVQASADQIAVVNTKATDSLGALNALTFNPQGDLRPQFDKFNSAVKGLAGAANDLDAKMTAVQAKAQAYLDNWSSQNTNMANQQVQALSEQRKAAVSARLNAALNSYQNVKASLKPFTSDLTDIQTYLNNDLTAHGVAAVKDIVAKTKADAVPVRDSIRLLQSDFTALATSLSPVMPASGK